jgi:hypothetical protein
MSDPDLQIFVDNGGVDACLDVVIEDDPLIIVAETVGANDAAAAAASAAAAAASAAQAAASAAFNAVTFAAGAAYVAAATDDLIIVQKAAGGPTTVTMVASATRTRGPVWVKDGKGDAATNNITVNFNGAEKADGLVSVPIRTAFGSVALGRNPAGGWVILNFG